MDGNKEIALQDESIFPDEEVLKGVLQEAYPSYRKLISTLDQSGIKGEWRYYKDGKAWLCKFQHKKKTVLWMSVWQGFLKATVYFPQSRLETLLNSELDETAKQLIRQADNVGKTVPCTFEISGDELLGSLESAVHIKMNLK